MRLILIIIWAAIWLPLDAYAAEAERFIPDCASGAVLAHVRVARVERDGVLRLNDGRAVLLEGVRLPLEDPALSGRVQAALREMIRGTVSFTKPAADRYGRLRAQGFGHVWLQAALLEQGLARVAISPDRNECFPDLYEAEARGRARHAGLWAQAAYRVRRPDELKGAAGSFQLVEGQVSTVGRADSRTVIDFGGGFSAVIAPGDHRAFRDFDLDALTGRHVRVRGFVQDHRGRPEIALSNPGQIEVLD